MIKLFISIDSDNVIKSCYHVDSIANSDDIKVPDHTLEVVHVESFDDVPPWTIILGGTKNELGEYTSIQVSEEQPTFSHVPQNGKWVLPKQHVIDKFQARRQEALEASDWTQLADVPTIAGVVEWRQQLRDIPTQSDDPTEWVLLIEQAIENRPPAIKCA